MIAVFSPFPNKMTSGTLHLRVFLTVQLEDYATTRKYC